MNKIVLVYVIAISIGKQQEKSSWYAVYTDGLNI